MFTLTAAAAEQIIRAASSQQDGDELPCLRVAAKVEDGEIVYGMGFDEEREQDAVIESCGVTLLISPRSQMLLQGASLDFVELHPGEFQFVFMNPNEPPSACGPTGGCSGCGSKTLGGGCA